MPIENAGLPNAARVLILLTFLRSSVLRPCREEFFAVPDSFDPYREALVMETSTIWPPEFDDLPPAQKADLEARLHADAEKCPQLEYVRTHTGFCRQITVTAADVERLKA